MKQSTLLGAFTISTKLSAKDKEVTSGENIRSPEAKASQNTGSEYETKTKEKRLSVLKNAANKSNNEKPNLDSSLPSPKPQKNPRKRSGKSKMSLSHKQEDEYKAQDEMPASELRSPKKEMSYTDYIAEITSEGKERDTRCVTKKSPPKPEIKPSEKNPTKPSMSYADFVKLFNQAPSESPSTEKIPKDCPDDKEESDIVDQEPPVKSKSITSFFSPSVKKKEKGPKESNVITVVAEVHPINGSMSPNAVSSPLKLKHNKKAKDTSDPDAIEYLGSETFSDTKDKKVSIISSKKRKNKNDTDETESVKKQKIENENVVDVNDDFTKERVDEDKPMENMSSAKKNAAQSANMTSQSQLCFGKGGLCLAKTKTDSSPDGLQESEDNSEKKLKRKRGRPPKLKRTDKSDGLAENESPKCDSKGNEKLERDAIYETKGKLSEQAITEPENIEVACETPSLRRSSRISRPVRPVMEVVDAEAEDEDDDCIEVDKDGEKQQRKKRPHRQAETPTNVNPPKKPKGPLAPIFTTMKPKEVELPPPEDPEKVRLRREFMMSGIPDELKKQIATVNQTAVILDYPVFPRPSHVQQLSEADREVHKYSPNIHKVVINEPRNLDTFDVAWKNFVCKSYTSEPDKKTFESFIKHTALTGTQVKAILTSWQQTDTKFKFEKVFAQLSDPLQKIDASEQAQSLPGTLSTPSSKSSKGAVKDEVDIIEIDDASPVLKASDNVVVDYHSVQWTDLHQPTSSSDLLGNASAVSRLKDWLQEWKAIVQRDAKKARKKMTQTPKGKSKGCWSDDSDFTDSEEEDLQLCNTMLLTGPHGVGKTSAVYALAQEMGYKVFEVNSSSLRSGKQILAQLEEATQSHRVAPSKVQNSTLNEDSDTPSTKLLSQAAAPLGKKPKATKSVATAFANLFQLPSQGKNSKGGKATCKSDSKQKEQGKKQESKERAPVNSGDAKKNSGADKKSRKTGKVEKKVAEDSKSTGTQNLATTSLILFDEVDIVFEEDKGFLSTIQHFMTSTKIPIVLTSRTDTIGEQLQARYENLTFRAPSEAQCVNYLGCVCLAHDLMVSHQALQALVNLAGRDIRSCLLLLQFLCQSGGGRSLREDDINTSSLISQDNNCHVTVQTKSKILDIDASVNTEVTNLLEGYSDDSNSCGPLLSLRRRPMARLRGIVDDDDDESSNSSCQSVQSKDQGKDGKSTNKTQKPCGSQLEVNTEHSIAAESIGRQGSELLPHQDLVESLLGLTKVQLSTQTVKDLIKSPQDQHTKLDRAIHVSVVINKAISGNSLYLLALHSSAVPKCEAMKVKLTLPSPTLQPTQGKKRKRILEHSWLDSEESDDEEKEKVEACNPAKTEIPHEDDAHSNQEASVSCLSSAQFSQESVPSADVKLDSCPLKIEMLSEQHAAGKRKELSVKSKTCIGMLSDLTRFYDSMSLLDTLTIHGCCGGEEGREITFGVSDEEKSPRFDTHRFAEEIMLEMESVVSLLAARQVGRRLEARAESWNTSVEQEISQSAPDDQPFSWPNEFCLPVGSVAPHLLSLSHNSQSLGPTDISATRNVVSGLGSTILSTDKALHMDYLPCLREICRCENARQLAKTQRRFHHYLDNAGLMLKKSTLACLTSTYS